MRRGPPTGRPPAAGPSERLESLTGLRFLAALAVFMLHLAVLVPTVPYARWLYRGVVQGGAGVSFFFVLSGFVLTWSAPAGDRARAFYRRRAARILPNHLVTWGLALGVLGALRLLPGTGPALGSLFLVQAWVPSARWYSAVNTPAWSLGCEMFFYALFPAILRVLSPLSAGRRRLLLAVAVIVVLDAAVASGPATYGTFGYWSMYYLPLTRLAEFVIGILVAREVREGTWPALGLAPACLLAAASYAAAGWAPAGFRDVAVTVVPFSLLVAAAARRDLTGRRSWLARPTAVRLGRWSYAFYLVHYPLLILVGHAELGHHPGAAGAVVIGALALAGTLAASWLLYSLVERPLERALRAARRRPAAAPSGELAPVVF